MHYYQHHVGDYQRDTSSLSILEHGVYRLLMDEYYVTERPLPVGLDALCRTCRAITRAERLAVSIVVEKFFQVDGTVLRHRRIEAEIADYRGLQEIAARAGRASAKARQRKLNGRSTGVAVPLQRESNAPTNGTATNHEPLTNNHTSPNGEVATQEVPMVARGRRAEPITDEYLAELATVYPYANVQQEFRKAKAWAATKRKTVSRLRLLGWLNRIEPPPQVNGSSAGELKF